MLLPHLATGSSAQDRRLAPLLSSYLHYTASPVASVTTKSLQPLAALYLLALLLRVVEVELAMLIGPKCLDEVSIDRVLYI